MTDRHTVDSINSDQLDQLYDELERARQELADRAAADSADAAAGSYAGRAERVEAQLAAIADLIADHEGDEWAAHPATTVLRGILDSEEYAIAQSGTAQANLLVTVAAPNPVNAVRWAGHVRDLVHAEFDGSMRLHTSIELEPGGSARTTPDNPPTSSDLAGQLRTAIASELYEYRERTMWWPEETGGVTKEIARLATRGALEALGLTEPAPPAPRDPCPHCEASSDRVPRAELGQHIAAQHPEVRAGGA